jgi:hypothetical protein
MTLRLFGLGIIHQSTKMDRFSPEQLEMLRREDHGPKIIALVISFTVLSFTFVVLRFFTRIRLTHLIGTEDYLVALSMVCFKHDYDDEALFTFLTALFDCDCRDPDQTGTMGCWQAPNLR